jgi:hypothetical protein
MLSSFAWVYVCILEGGHFLIPDADANCERGDPTFDVISAE